MKHFYFEKRELLTHRMQGSNHGPLSLWGAYVSCTALPLGVNGDIDGSTKREEQTSEVRRPLPPVLARSNIRICMLTASSLTVQRPDVDCTVIAGAHNDLLLFTTFLFPLSDSWGW